MAVGKGGGRDIAYIVLKVVPGIDGYVVTVDIIGAAPVLLSAMARACNGMVICTMKVRRYVNRGLERRTTALQDRGAAADAPSGRRVRPPPSAP